MYFPALGLLCVMSCNGNSSHRNDLTFRTLCRNVTSDEFLRKKIDLNCLQCTSLNLVYFKESFPYGVPCFLIMQKTSFQVQKDHVLQCERPPFALRLCGCCLAALLPTRNIFTSDGCRNVSFPMSDTAHSAGMSSLA